MKDDGIDILMITYNRPAYTQLSLSRLLETCDDSMRVWLWQNGSDPETMEVVKPFLDHPNVHQYHHSSENLKLNHPTNWLWENAKGTYLTKVDDDCLMPLEWATTLRKAHQDEPRFGILGCWRFRPEDFLPEVADRKINTFSGGHRIMQNCWIEGSGYLMKRACVEQNGLLGDDASFPGYGMQLARQGWIHGWYYPFLFQEHMDDPRSEHSLLKTDEGLATHAPLMAKRWGVTTSKKYGDFLRHEARLLQKASPNPKHHSGWRLKIRQYSQRIKRLVGGKFANDRDI